ncbi:hypothetical protein BH11VER1_BH11VER1_26650 [soil metagenome]
MKKLHIPMLVAAFAVLAAQSALAGSGLGYLPSDTVKTVLERQSGQLVELRLKSGEKISGKVDKVGDKSVHIIAITGQELFEALVLLDDVSAVVVRAAAK